VFSAHVPGLKPGALYGLRADGHYAPQHGRRFDPAKLLADPYARAIDRPFAFDHRLCLPRERHVDTAPLVPKSVATDLPTPVPLAPPRLRPGGLIYELQVRSFTMRHPEIPEHLRGTIAALAHPAILDHLTRLGVDAIELMPITAWIDERHLAPLGLGNAWGYNPVLYMAPDPRLCPGGLQELAATVAGLHAAGIGVLLDVVFNHTGEGDHFGPTLSLRGLDARAYFRHDAHRKLVNDAGTGNTLACDHPATRRLVLDAMRHFVRHAGIDGFRFDLAPILGREGHGFDRNARMFRDIAADPLLSSRILIAEPWDIGHGGYQLGNFPAAFLEWNDRYRDRARRFWRGDAHTLGEFATAIAGSSDVFPPPETRSVNFIAAHDGFALADLVAYAHKHNHANGEHNRDGHNDNHSWNNGTEGETDDSDIRAARRRDLRALLATLFASRGAIMLTAGDEFGRSQSGNNNAYAQDNALTWLDWAGRDTALERYCAELSALRRRYPALSDPMLLTGAADPVNLPDVAWLGPAGAPLSSADWHDGKGGTLAMILREAEGGRLAVLFNRALEDCEFQLPQRPGWHWQSDEGGPARVPARSVAFVREILGGPSGQSLI
jgi:glycogen operon protein